MITIPPGIDGYQLVMEFLKWVGPFGVLGMVGLVYHIINRAAKRSTR